MTSKSGRIVKPLNDLFLNGIHEKYSAKFVDYFQWKMPLHYESLTSRQSHLYTRNFGSIFDVSHMCQMEVIGKDSLNLLKLLSPSNVEQLSNNRLLYTTFLTENGGIIDDLIITKLGENYYYIVSNASRRHVVIDYLKKFIDSRNFCLEVNDLNEEKVLLAVQGPAVRQLLTDNFNKQISNIRFMNCRRMKLNDVDCLVSCCGYTGENGYELSIHNSYAEHLLEKLLKLKFNKKSLKLSGLAARDSLRIEAGLRLFGHEINETITPIEAGLSFVVNKKRLENDNDEFLGKKILRKQLTVKGEIKNRIVGFETFSGRTPRHKCVVVDEKEKETIGFVTSGIRSPILNRNIGMMFIDDRFTNIGQRIKFLTKNSLVEGFVTSTDFIPKKYKKTIN
ncbi:hypothetical protein SNEBB_002890 [Seison nebaliae]|nr:hypothetical protein SNEBB_002890 [Seison nebaliae]